ncbi:hypothetical protein BgAZ_303620 [Babesia gibsoni]|uniref:Mitochondrial carrier protein n=1 Tax=Babesia gibsoni TaxID=33632 RepID=A0AAD8LIK0_BABGI|nr:hypothetical protein BgAZ_303620 [Babesia gibsoni]
MESGDSSNSDVWNVLKGNVLGGLLLSSFTVPADVVRNYWYFNSELKGRRSAVNTIDVAQQIVKTRGFRCFFTGIHLTIFNVAVGQTIFLVTYDNLKGEASAPVASIIARMTTLLATQPVECLRTYRQANLSKDTKSFVGDRRGFALIRGCYKGLVSTIIRDVPFSALHWPLNDVLYRRTLSSLDIPEDRITKMQKFALSFVTGAISSTVATTVSQPFDIVKTKIQATTEMKKMTVNGELSKFFRQYGLSGFLIGLTPRLIKVVPGCAIISGFYRYFN